MLLFLFRLLGRFPLRVLHALGAFAGRMAYRVASYRRRFHSTWDRAAPGDAELRRAALAEAGKTMLELPWVWMRQSAHTQRVVDVEDWSPVDRALARGRGVICLTPHLGCFEILAQTYSEQRGRLTALYSPSRRADANALLERVRHRGGLSAAPATLGGVRQLARALRKGEAVGILPDQVPSRGEGVWAAFFGHPAYTMTLPAKLQALTGAAIVVGYAERLPRGAGYRVHWFEGPTALGDTPEAQAATLNAAMEALIMRCPTQYLWAYNRYKVPADVAPPTASSTADA